MVALRTLDAIALNKMRRSHRPESTRSPSKAHAQMGVVDRVSEIGRPQINREFGASRGDTWTHHDGPIKIEREKEKEDCGPESWDHGSS